MKQLVQLLSATILVSIVWAGEPTASPTPAPRFKISGWIDSGITFNPDSPQDNQNFGRFFDDRANEPLLNQTGNQFRTRAGAAARRVRLGFQIAIHVRKRRALHSFAWSVQRHGGYLDRPAGSGRSVSQSSLSHYHARVASILKLGKFVTLEGAETIDPRTNFFYSHTYIFNFGIPFNHTGGATTFHATKWLDLTPDVTRGVNTSIDDNNDSRLLFTAGSDSTFRWQTDDSCAPPHIGPETPNDNHDQRYLNCITTTWKITRQAYLHHRSQLCARRRRRC